MIKGQQAESLLNTVGNILVNGPSLPELGSSRGFSTLGVGFSKIDLAFQENILYMYNKQQND